MLALQLSVAIYRTLRALSSRDTQLQATVFYKLFLFLRTRAANQDERLVAL